MEYYLGLKRKEILTHMTKQMNVKRLMPGKINQSPKKQVLYDSTYMR